VTTRFNSSSMQAAANSTFIAYRTLVDVALSAGTLYACTGKDWIYALGNTYTPVGGLGTISSVMEEIDAFPRDITLQIAAINSASLYEPLQEQLFNKVVKIRRCFLDPITRTAVSTPELVWKGKISQVDINLENAYTEIRVETVLRRTAQVQYFNKETFQAIDSSDTFGLHIDQIPMFRSAWGQQDTAFAAPTWQTYYGVGAPAPANPVNGRKGF
jgi:hypothetical protein